MMGNLMQLSVTFPCGLSGHCNLPRKFLDRKVLRFSRDVTCKANQKPKKRKKAVKTQPEPSTLSENRAGKSFEQLSFAWDDAFQASCDDPEQAAALLALAQDGYQQHGRGCVFVTSKIISRDGKALKAKYGKGISKHLAGMMATESDGTELSSNPDLLQKDWNALYIPAQVFLSVGGLLFDLGEIGGIPQDQIVDVEATEVLPGSFQGSDENAGGSEEISTEHAEGDEGGREAAAAGPPLSTVSGGDRGGGSVAEALFASSVLPPPSPGGRRGPAAGGAGLDGCGVPQEKLEELGRLMRGMDSARMLTLMGTAGQGDEIGGERPYDPEDNELVLLLSVKVDGQPAVGGDLVKAVENGEGGVQLIMPQLLDSLAQFSQEE